MSKKHALITGGSGDIGQAIAQALALTNNYHVIIHTYQNLTKAEELVATIQQQGGSAQVCQFDLANPEQIQIALQKLLAQAPIQILINNAGIHADAPLAGMSPENWHQVIEVNLNSFYHLTQPLLLPMMATRWGRIINISSIAAITGNRGQANYSAAKAGLHGASKTLAIELASRNITVNVVAPGIIDTKMSKAQFSIEQIKALVPMQRAGRPEEVAALVSFLASDKASYISGQIISINGAMF
ncbi:MAG: 3-oxoacyl-ACP reductase [Gammaproteobacteria bacterium RIFCSPHIGHO2_12_FULL_35_23]|nr:MAG: 3-oxoacyl-ACP reductase [Gammaproteobacteria bacterium RIFCSPHIGHO2_12_FULL_35_23]